MKLTSTQNPRIKHIRKLLRQKKTREEFGEFVVEGTQAVAEAYENGWEIRLLLHDADNAPTETAQSVINATPPSSQVAVGRNVLATLSDRPNPGELLAVVGQRSLDASAIPTDDDLLLILLENPRDPGNVGSIIRTADAIGATAVGLIGDSVDVYAPKTVRATMGSLFAVPTPHFADVSAVSDFAARAKAQTPSLTVIGTSPSSEQAIYDVDMAGPTVLVVGNERKGMTPALESVCDAVATIPMFGSAESLNSAVSASIVLYEAMRQRLTVRPR